MDPIRVDLSFDSPALEAAFQQHTRAAKAVAVRRSAFLRAAGLLIVAARSVPQPHPAPGAAVLWEGRRVARRRRFAGSAPSPASTRSGTLAGLSPRLSPHPPPRPLTVPAAPCWQATATALRWSSCSWPPALCRWPPCAPAGGCAAAPNAAPACHCVELARVPPPLLPGSCLLPVPAASALAGCSCLMCSLSHGPWFDERGRPHQMAGRRALGPAAPSPPSSPSLFQALRCRSAGTDVLHAIVGCIHVKYNSPSHVR